MLGHLVARLPCSGFWLLLALAKLQCYLVCALVGPPLSILTVRLLAFVLGFYQYWALAGGWKGALKDMTCFESKLLTTGHTVHGAT